MTTSTNESKVKISAGGLRVIKQPLLEWEVNEKHGEHWLRTTELKLRLNFVDGKWAALVRRVKDDVTISYLGLLTMDRVPEEMLGVARATAMAFFLGMIEEHEGLPRSKQLLQQPGGVFPLYAGRYLLALELPGRGRLPLDVRGGVTSGHHRRGWVSRGGYRVRHARQRDHVTTPYPERCLHPRLCWWPDPHVFSALTVCLPWTRPPGGMAFQPAGYCPTSNVRFGVRKCDTSAWYVTYTYQPRLGEWVGPRKWQHGQPLKNCRLYTSGWKLRCLSKPKPGGLCRERPWGA